MAIKLGIHTGPQDLSFEELKRLWQRADGAGYHWISVWDHFYANPIREREDPMLRASACQSCTSGADCSSRVRPGSPTPSDA
jgi:hypothetical protein